MDTTVYSLKELYDYRAQRSYGNDATEAAFLLGGIGTGTVSLSAQGEFKDWEVFNRPGKGNNMPYSFFSIWAKKDNCPSVSKLLETRLRPPYNQAHGYYPGKVAGLPRFDSSEMRGEYPFVWIDFNDAELPVRVSLEAFTPFIPLNADDSGIPGTIIRYKIKNTSDKPTDVTIAGSLPNFIGFDGFDAFENMKKSAKTFIKYKEEGGLKGLFYSSDLQSHQLKYGNLALMTTDENITMKPEWLKGLWWDGIQDFWDDFSSDGRLERESNNDAVRSKFGAPEVNVGSLGIYHRLMPEEEKVFEFILAWYFPNRTCNWDEDDKGCDSRIMKNYYSRLFTDAWHAGKYLSTNMDKLERLSREFHRAIFNSTLPGYVIDAVASNITVLRSNTCFRIEDGTFLAFEGCHARKGSCEGTCTHVWNYAQSVAFLFPELEQSARNVEFNLETDDMGKMAFRSRRVFGLDTWDMLPAADGQMGTIVRLYREWKLSGNDEFLKKVWSNASKALDFAFSYWDTDGDYVLDGKQHNTYDIEFYGPSSLTGSLFYAALKAGAEMAEYLGDTEHSIKYREAFEKGSKRMDELLWNGEYYVQGLEDVDKYRYQYGKGCLSDQLLGQTLAHVAGLGYILPMEHVKKAVSSIFKYNFHSNFLNQQSVQRVYALNDEKGLLLCTWPKGGRPRLPFVYSDEVWTGIEYQVAAHLIFEGYINEGLTVVKAIRERYDGYRRNPWNEVECGYHYARSMASWAVLIALSGFRCDIAKGVISFDPKINQENFSSFWSTGKAWGIYRQKKNSQSGELEKEIEVLYGDKEGITIQAV